MLSESKVFNYNVVAQETCKTSSLWLVVFLTRLRCVGRYPHPHELQPPKPVTEMNLLIDEFRGFLIYGLSELRINALSDKRINVMLELLINAMRDTLHFH